jgi:hypothetical protein
MTAVPHGALGNTETVSARPDTQERELEGHVRLAHTSAAPEASIRDGSRLPRGPRIVRRESGAAYTVPDCSFVERATGLELSTLALER